MLFRDRNTIFCLCSEQATGHIQPLTRSDLCSLPRLNPRDGYLLEQAAYGGGSDVAIYWNLCRNSQQAVVDNGFPKDVCPDVSADVCVARIDKNGQRSKWIPNAGRIDADSTTSTQLQKAGPGR